MEVPLSIPEKPPVRLAYRIPEIADQLGISRAHVYNLISRGEVRAVKIGGAVRVPATELDRLLADGGDAA